jgi:large repetitive protein
VTARGTRAIDARGARARPTSIGLAILAALAGTAAADPTSGIDGALFRSAYDANGVFAVEGARLLPRRDLSFKVLVGYGRAPVVVALPGIGGSGDTAPDRVLDHLVTLDMAFGMTLTDRLALGIDVAAYRTATGDGYGVRGRYTGAGTATRSTGLIALRRLSNIDPSASPRDPTAYQGDGLAGPLDARFGLKLGIIQRDTLAIAAVGSVFLPFGEDEMLLGDRDLVFEPKLAFEWRPDRRRATRVVANTALRIRRRAVLESFDAMDPAASDADARVVLDVGSELVAGLGAVVELTPRVHLAAEGQVFVPVAESLTWGECRRFDGRRCNTLAAGDYFANARAGDLAVLATAGLAFRISPDVTWQVMVGAGPVGARGEDLRVATALVWAPQPTGSVALGSRDRDGDGIPDGLDGCPDEPEDRDGFLDEDGCPDLDNDGDGLADTDDQCPDDPEDRDGFEDEDGCPERDNDGDGVIDAADRCPDQPEDRDGFEDEDGCPDDDNDGDGIPDAADRCPDEPETINGIEDEDGCPDVRGVAGPEERADRIDLRGGAITFERGALSAASKQQLAQIAAIIKLRKLAIRVEVHVALGTRSTQVAVIANQRRRDKQLSQQRAKLIRDHLVAQGVPAAQLQAVGLGSDRPLGSNPADPSNERVDFLKARP